MGQSMFQAQAERSPTLHIAADSVCGGVGEPHELIQGRFPQGHRVGLAVPVPYEVVAIDSHPVGLPRGNRCWAVNRASLVQPNDADWEQRFEDWHTTSQM